MKNYGIFLYKAKKNNETTCILHESFSSIDANHLSFHGLWYFYLRVFVSIYMDSWLQELLPARKALKHPESTCKREFISAFLDKNMMLMPRNYSCHVQSRGERFIIGTPRSLMQLCLRPNSVEHVLVCAIQVIRCGFKHASNPNWTSRSAPPPEKCGATH